MNFLYNTGDWFTLSPGYDFRKFDLYNIEWLQGVNLDNLLVIGAPHGGPIAITKDSRKYNKHSGTSKTIIKIFTSSGKPLGTVHVSLLKLLP